MERTILTKIINEPIALDDVFSFVAENSCGAEVYFSGVVRNANISREVEGIYYDVHRPLAEKFLAEIAEAAAEKCETSLRIIAIHRVGYLKVGESSVVIGVSSTHRDAAFEICRTIIEEIKKRIPIWKNEYYANGEHGWLAGNSLRG